jgi:MFS family permease
MRENQLIGTLATVLALLLGFGLLQVGNTLQGTLLAVRGGMEKFSATEIGLIGSGFSVGLVFGSLWGGRLIQAVGQTRAFAALAALASAAALLHLMLVDSLAWIFFRALTGFCFAGLLMSVESWLNGAASPSIRGQILGFYSMTGLIAGVCGQLLLPVADPGGYRLFCIASVVISIALVPVSVSRSPAPAGIAGRARADLRRLYSQSPFGLAAAFLCGIITGAFFALGPFYAQAQGLAAGGIATFMALATLGAVATTWPLGWLSDRMDRRFLVIGVSLASALLLVMMMMMQPEGRMPRWIIFAQVFLFGGLVLPIYGVVVAHVNDAVSPSEFVAASGGLLIVQGTGMATGPLLGGLAMTAVGNNGLAWLIIGALFLVAAWGWYRLTRRPKLPGEREREHFQPMTVSPVGTQLIEASQRAS